MPLLTRCYCAILILANRDQAARRARTRIERANTLCQPDDPATGDLRAQHCFNLSATYIVAAHRIVAPWIECDDALGIGLLRKWPLHFRTPAKSSMERDFRCRRLARQKGPWKRCLRAETGKLKTTTREPAAVVGVRRALRAEALGDHIRRPAHVSFETSSLTLGTPMPVTMSWPGPAL